MSNNSDVIVHKNKVYLVIDLKTFYASVECVERNLDPFSTNLVVADPSRGKGGICLAITPAMKMLGIKNRCRLYEIPPNVEYMVALPRMQKYIDYSAKIYAIYLKYISKDDIYPYSIDECFLDVTNYLKAYKMNGLALAKIIIKDIFDTYGITATCGIGTNMYLAKVALDIMSKHNVTNIGWLNEERYKKELWHHKPLTDFWQIGNGIEKRLNRMRLFDMYDIAHCDESRLYKAFGVNAEFLIDHSKGIETCTIEDIKKYKPKSNSISSSQVLFQDYEYSKARLVLKEMVEILSQRLISEKKLTGGIKLYIGYSKDMLKAISASKRLSYFTNQYSKLVFEFLDVFDKHVDKNVPIRRIGISFDRLEDDDNEQLDLFQSIEEKNKEKQIEKTIIEIKSKLGKNAIIKGMNLEEGATTLIRNQLIGGHNGY